jgi:flagellar biosynthesis protein FliQ
MYTGALKGALLLGDLVGEPSEVLTGVLVGTFNSVGILVGNLGIDMGTLSGVPVTVGALIVGVFVGFFVVAFTGVSESGVTGVPVGDLVGVLVVTVVGFLVGSRVGFKVGAIVRVLTGYIYALGLPGVPLSLFSRQLMGVFDVIQLAVSLFAARTLTRDNDAPGTKVRLRTLGLCTLPIVQVRTSSYQQPMGCMMPKKFTPLPSFSSGVIFN